MITFHAGTDGDDSNFDEKVVPLESQAAAFDFVAFRFGENHLQFVHQDVELGVGDQNGAGIRLREDGQRIFRVVEDVDLAGRPHLVRRTRRQLLRDKEERR